METAYDRPATRHSSSPTRLAPAGAPPPPSAMAAPPAMASAVPSHHSGTGARRVIDACSAPANSGPLPMATVVPTATPASRTPAKNARL